MLNIPRWKQYLILATCIAGIIFASPNLLNQRILDRLPDWLPKNQIVLGLDLQGGSHLALEVDTRALVRDLYDTIAHNIRKALREAHIGYVGLKSDENGVRLKIRDGAQVDSAVSVIKKADKSVDVTVLESGAIEIKAQESALKDRQEGGVNQSIEILRRRIDGAGTKEPIIQRQGASGVIVQLPGVEDPDHIKSLIGKTAKLEFRLVDTSVSVFEALKGNVPPGVEVLPSYKKDAEGHKDYFVVRKRVELGGETLVDAQPGFGQNGQPVVVFRLDSMGAKRFAEVTRENVHKPFAVVLDGKVVMAPTIREPIPGGSSEISGDFSVREANDLALLLRAGALPAPLKIIEERTVGPGLGADSIRSGLIATVVAVILVVTFMVFYYSFFGLIADVALIFNLILLFAALSVLQATLTLPGIAGIALSLGMAVDANVLIYERVKEEFRNGNSIFSSVDVGYRRAMGTIVDSNLTTIIGGAIMYQFGTGPIKGFAVTLSLGIIISMFTAISLSRVIIAYWYKKCRPKELPI